MTTKMLVLAAIILAGTGSAFGVVKNDKGRIISNDSPAIKAPAAAVVATETPAAPAAEKQAGACCTFSDVTTAATNDKGRAVGSATKSVMSCSMPGGCKSAVENFLTTGKFEHACGGMTAKCH